MSIDHHGHEHEFEPQYGLPERLPAGERILWQGSPDFRTLAVRVFHLRKLAVYFAIVVLWKDWTVATAPEGTPGQIAWALAWPWLLAAVALGTLAGLAWLTARTAVYTLTDKRIVMRIGIVLTLTFNLPYRQVAAAALKRGARGCGDIVLTLAGRDRIAFLQLWPHVRPWRIQQPEPMLRAVPDAETVARTLVDAWQAATGGVAAPVVRADAPRPITPVQPAAAAPAAPAMDEGAAGAWAGGGARAAHGALR